MVNKPYPPVVDDEGRKLLQVIKRGHPTRTMKMKRKGRQIEVRALTWEELALASDMSSSSLQDGVASLVANDYIESGTGFSGFWRALVGVSPTYFWITQKGMTFLERSALSASPPPNDKHEAALSTGLKEVEAFAQVLGYDLTRYGVAVALLGLQSGYSSLEAASHLAVATLALDAKEAGDDLMRLLALAVHARSVIHIMTDYHQRHPAEIREEILKNDTVAMRKIVTIDKDQNAWIERVLSDPALGGQRVATSRIDYASLG